jgi:predicted AAA+ superfamily ATPase
VVSRRIFKDVPALIERSRVTASVERALARAPVTLLIGPRQCGKTTLARAVAASRPSTYFDLEDPATPLRGDDAREVLGPLRGLIVIDELQRRPDLFALLRVLADRAPRRARFLILGSASPDLVRGASESLAGRVEQVEMAGLDVTEVPPTRHRALFVRGGFPRSFLARTDDDSHAWRSDFVTTFLERDIPQLGIRVPAHALRRFWTMLAHFHGGIWNGAELARSMGASESSVRHYLDILAGAFMVRQLPPWFENVGKRLVKAPKIYLRDSGLLHALLGVRTRLQVLAHPKLGASWEGFALDQIVRRVGAERDAYFYRTHAGAELDLLVMRNGKRYGFEMKFGDSPAVTKSMHVAIEDLGLEHLWIVHPGERSDGLRERISTLALRDLDATAHRHRLA